MDITTASLFVNAGVGVGSAILGATGSYFALRQDVKNQRKDLIDLKTKFEAHEKIAITTPLCNSCKENHGEKFKDGEERMNEMAEDIRETRKVAAATREDTAFIKGAIKGLLTTKGGA